MNKSSRADKEDFQQDLNTCRSIVQAHRAGLEENPLMRTHLDFWLESTQFCITELEIWDELGDREKYNETVKKLQKILNDLHQLMIRLTEEDYSNYGTHDNVD